MEQTDGSTSYISQASLEQYTTLLLSAQAITSPRTSIPCFGMVDDCFGAYGVLDRLCLDGGVAMSEAYNDWYGRILDEDGRFFGLDAFRWKPTLPTNFTAEQWIWFRELDRRSHEHIRNLRKGWGEI